MQFVNLGWDWGSGVLIQDFRKLCLSFILETSSGLRLLEHLEKYYPSSFPMGKGKSRPEGRNEMVFSLGSGKILLFCF